MVTNERLLEILLCHLDRIEDDLRADVLRTVEIVSRDERPGPLTDFGQWQVFFLNLCEDRSRHGFYRILREFLPGTIRSTSPSSLTQIPGL